MLFAVGALEGLVLGVQDHVFLQVRPPSEIFLANLTFPTFTLSLPNGNKLLCIFRMKSLHVLGERLPAGVELMTVRTLVLLLMKVGVAAVLLPVNSQVILCRIALVTNITLKGLLTCVHTCVALVFPYPVEGFIAYGALQGFFVIYLNDHGR